MVMELPVIIWVMLGVQEEVMVTVIVIILEVTVIVIVLKTKLMELVLISIMLHHQVKLLNVSCQLLSNQVIHQEIHSDVMIMNV